MVACSVENNVPMDSTRIWIKETGITGTFPDLKRYTVPYHCMHCKDPSCVCIYACPFGVPNYEWNDRFPLVVKCDMCISRLGEGEQPACAATCPTGAILFGKYEEVVAEAHKRINENPDKYVNHVYGEEENGGTATMYISPVPFEELGFPVAEITSPAYSNRLVTEGTPMVAGAMLVGLSGAYLTIKHLKEDAERERLEAEQEQSTLAAGEEK
jgi:formate dehydrogenase iron-sulfur subunit